MVALAGGMYIPASAPVTSKNKMTTPDTSTWKLKVRVSAEPPGQLSIEVLKSVNMRGVREGALVQNVFTVLKVGAIAVLVLVGFGSGKGSFTHFTPLLGTELGAKGLQMGLFAAMDAATSRAAAR